MPKPETPTSIGARIKKIRTRKKISLDKLANETGYSTEYLNNLEKGAEMPPVGTLLHISRALHINSGELMGEQREALDQRAEAYAKRTRNYAYTNLTSVSEHNHLGAFRIYIKAGQDHEGVGYQHEGEEFLYVLKGCIEVTVGDHVNRLEPGQSLHFNSGIQHHMLNAGTDDAELLVVVYNP